MRYLLATVLAVLTLSSPAFASSVTDVAVDNSIPSSAAGARTRYVITFKVSDTCGLSAQANSRIDIVLPGNSTFIGYTGGTVSAGGADVGSCPSPSNGVFACSLSPGKSIAAGSTVTLTLVGIGNTNIAGPQTASIDTTSDSSLQPSAPFTVVAANPVTGVTVDNTNPSAAAGARTRYVIRFTTSATGRLAASANSRIQLAAFSGTTFGGWAGGTVSAGGQDVGTCSTPTGLGIDCSLLGGKTIEPSTPVTLTLNGVTNTATATNGAKLAVTSTSDPALVTSPDFAVLAAGAVSAVSVALGAHPLRPALPRVRHGRAGGRGQQPHRGHLPGRDDVRRLGGWSRPGRDDRRRRLNVSTTSDPAPVTSPDYGQAAPEATPSPTPTPEPTETATPEPTASPIATIAATATPTPTPAATPQPEFNRDVVVVPSGLVEVCDRPGVGCVKLVAGAEVPVNKTIDAREGVVVLSSIGRDGKVEIAKFYDGMFKVSQTAMTTDLTLNEPLAPCSSKKKARAAAGKKKPRTRRLWGDGKGRFRTRGSFSAATVRGTKWLTEDSCAGTSTRVATGVVSVRDNVRGRTITLRAGKRYTAKPR